MGCFAVITIPDAHYLFCRNGGNEQDFLFWKNGQSRGLLKSKPSGPDGQFLGQKLQGTELLIQPVQFSAQDRLIARKTGVHAHISEYPNEVNASLERHRLRPVEYLDRLGVLGPHFLAAHSILLSDDEIDLMAERGVKVVHCPFSNCGKGVPYTPRLLQRGASVGLGTDGAAHGGLSLWNEMKIFRSVMNARVGVPYANPVVMPARTILRMATQGGAAALGYEGRLGTVKAGYLADLISIRLNQPHILPTSDLTNTLLESVNAGDVADSMVQGRFLMRDRRGTDYG